MKFPLYLKSYEKEIMEAQENLGPYLNVKIIEWLRNFKRDELSYIIPLLKNYEVIDEIDLRDYCQRLHFQNLKIFKGETKYCVVGLGPAGKSGQSILYYYRTANSIETEKCFFQNQIEQALEAGYDKFIFVDDFIASGTQATEFFNDFIEDYPENLEIVYSSILATKEGIDYIKNNIQKKDGRITINASITFSESDKAFLSRHIYDTNEFAEKGKEICREYGTVLFEKHPLGYKNGQFLISFFYNTPDNTLPIFWSKTNNWKPLFNRFEDPPKPKPSSPKEENIQISIAHNNVISSSIYRYVNKAINGPTILWIDDKPSNNRQEIEIFKSLGIKTVKFKSTSEGLKYLEQNETPNLLISDLYRKESPSITGLPGFYLSNQVLNLYPKLPIIIYTKNVTEHLADCPEKVYMTEIMEDLIGNALVKILAQYEKSFKNRHEV